MVACISANEWAHLVTDAAAEQSTNANDELASGHHGLGLPEPRPHPQPLAEAETWAAAGGV